MIRLRKILLCDFLYYFLLVLVLLLTFFRVSERVVSHYTKNSDTFYGIITNIKIDGDLLSLTLKDKKGECVLAYYTFNSESEKERSKSSFLLGDLLKVDGEFSSVRGSTTKNIFNYEEYLTRKKTFYSIRVDSITKVRSTKNIFYILKNSINNYFCTFKSGKYLSLLLLGDKTYIEKEIISSFQTNGISHLFAISGMHVGILSSIILKSLKRVRVHEEKRYLITCFLLFIYLLLTGCTSSVTRAFLFFLLFTMNKVYYLQIESIFIFILTLVITLLFNPYFIYDIGFQYSFLISFTLIVGGELINKHKNYFVKLIITSCFSFMVSVPITAYHFYQINFLSILYNLFYVPFVTILLFPFSLIVLVFRPLSFFLDFLISILEYSSLFLSKIDTFCFILGKVPIVIYILYLIFFFLFLKCLKKKVLFLYLLLVVFHYFYFNIFDSDYLVMLDIGQGDSFLMHSKGKSILIDTGGVMQFSYESWRKKSIKYQTDSITIPYLKSRGIKRLDYLLLTHGDFDHLGEAVNIIKHYKVRKVFINEGRINSLEKKIVSMFSKTEVCTQNTSFEVGNFKFLSLNKDLGDENSSSIVLYALYKDYKMLFMGDANFKSEDYLLKTYNLDKVNLLKLGHHGSKSSSTLPFLEQIKPDIALISAGRDNKFKHPNKETLERLRELDIKYYITNKLGTVEINFQKNSIEY